jgi:hypothetical protein
MPDALIADARAAAPAWFARPASVEASLYMGVRTSARTLIADT